MCSSAWVQVTVVGRKHWIIIIVITVIIISQMRRAQPELCPSSSGWLTVTNSSLIHSAHQLYTGQRIPERQEAAETLFNVCHLKLQHKSTLHRSVFSPYHRWPPPATLSTGGSSLSDILHRLLLCDDVKDFSVGGWWHWEATLHILMSTE